MTDSLKYYTLEAWDRLLGGVFYSAHEFVIRSGDRPLEGDFIERETIDLRGQEYSSGEQIEADLRLATYRVGRANFKILSTYKSGSDLVSNARIETVSVDLIAVKEV